MLINSCKWCEKHFCVFAEKEILSSFLAFFGTIIKTSGNVDAQALALQGLDIMTELSKWYLGHCINKTK